MKSVVAMAAMNSRRVTVIPSTAQSVRDTLPEGAVVVHAHIFFVIAFRAIIGFRHVLIAAVAYADNPIDIALFIIGRGLGTVVAVMG